MLGEERQPLTDEDLLGITEVVLRRPPIQSRSMPETKIFILEHEGKEYRIGVIGNEAYESIKKHGWKDSEGKIHLKVPKTCLRPNGWINSLTNSPLKGCCMSSKAVAYLQLTSLESFVDELKRRGLYEARLSDWVQRREMFERRRPRLRANGSWLNRS